MAELDLSYEDEIAEDTLALLGDLGVEDPMSVLEPFFDADQLADQGTRPDAPIAGQTQSLVIQLIEEDRKEIARELCDLLDDYDRAMADRNDREEEIRDAIAMIPPTASGGTSIGSESVVSEMAMSFCDQAYARIATGILGITPIMRVDAVEAAGFEGDEAVEAAEATENFLEEYGKNGPPDLRHQLPMILQRSVKVGTGVVYAEWVDEVRRRRSYMPGQADPVVKESREGKLKLHLIDNRDVKIWPPTPINWQDATFVGHEARHTPESWRGIARRYGLSEEIREMISKTPSDRDEKGEAEQRRHGIDTQNLEAREELQPVALTELWCRMTLPGDDDPTAFQVILHRPTRTIAYIGHNPHFSEKFPSFPIRYKWQDSSAWGDGVGHEIIWSQAADTAMWCLELDNLMAGAYSVVLRRAGSMYNTQTDEPRPGMQIAVDDVDKDFKPVKLGGEAPELQSSRNNNYMRARTGSGLSSVMSGQGDPVMKSGAGTGSVLALIEQGDKKMRMVDTHIREDLSDLYMFMLECVAQYAPDGLFYRYVNEDRAETLKMLKYTPPRGDIQQMFRLRAQAPSAGTSDEARKEKLLLVASLALQHITTIDAMVTEYLTTNNPPALPRWKESVANYLLQIHLQVVKLHEVPRVPEMVPTLPEMSDQDQQMMDLQTQLEEAMAQIEQLTAEAQQAMQPPQPGMPGMEGGAPPMDPSMMGGDPSQMGEMPQGMPPEMMQGMMGGGMPMGGDPNVVA